VRLTPQPASDADSTMGRLTIDKEFHGGLQAIHELENTLPAGL
jgi:hypothetical protein